MKETDVIFTRDVTIGVLPALPALRLLGNACAAPIAGLATLQIFRKPTSCA